MRPETPDETAGHRLQEFISGGVSKGVVDEFELIQIEEEHRQFSTGILGGPLE